MLEFPEIPSQLLDERDLTVPSLDWLSWARSAFIDDPKSRLFNPDHSHLQIATIGFLLTNVENVTKGREIRGTCGLGDPTGDKWLAAQRRQLIRSWFGGVPIFIVTLNAVYLSTATPGQICRLVEHELYHAGIERDRFGAPIREKGTGRFRFALRPHDLEDFVGVARRYGAVTPEQQAMKAAFDEEPLFPADAFTGVCGCGARL